MSPARPVLGVAVGLVAFPVVDRSDHVAALIAVARDVVTGGLVDRVSVRRNDAARRVVAGRRGRDGVVVARSVVVARAPGPVAHRGGRRSAETDRGRRRRDTDGADRRRGRGSSGGRRHGPVRPGCAGNGCRREVSRRRVRPRLVPVGRGARRVRATVRPLRRVGRPGDTAGGVTGATHRGGVETAGREDRHRLGLRQFRRGLHEGASELCGGEAVGALGPGRPLQHGGERTEVGRHRQQPVDATGQRGLCGVTGERHRTGHRLDEHQRERVHVGLRVDGQSERLLRRGVARRVRRNRRHVLPRALTQQAGHPEVDDTEPTIGSEDHLRRGELGVEQALLVGGVEGATRLEADDQRLSGLEETAPVEQVAQAAPAERLDRVEDSGRPVDLDLAPVEDRRDVGVRQGVRDLGEPAELVAEVRVLRPLGSDQLEGDRTVAVQVDRVEDDGVLTGRDRPRDAVAPGQDPAVESARSSL